jgi:hypothetical protein
MQFKTLQDEKNFNRYYREVLDHIDDLATIPGPNPGQEYVYKIYAKGYEAKACARRYVREEKLGDLHVVGRRMR